MTEKLCKNCAHYDVNKYDKQLSKCRASITMTEPFTSVITGTTVAPSPKIGYCTIERQELHIRDSCGPDAKLFQEKIPTFWDKIRKILHV